MLSLVAVACLVILTGKSCGLTEVPCPRNRTESPSLLGKRVPKLPKAYQAQILGTVVQRAATFTAEENVDTFSKIAIAMKRTNGWDKNIYNGDTNETYLIRNGACTVQHHLVDPVDHYKESAADQDYPLTVFSMLKMSQTTREYLGKSVVRGLTTNHWQSCGRWPGVNGTVRLDFYFTEPTAPAKTYDIPVRCEVKGHGIHLIFDYFGFVDNVDPSVFLISTKMVCSGRTPTRTIPKLKSQFCYRMEKKRKNGIIDLDVWYDYDTKIVRQDYRQKQTCRETLCSPHSITDIQDYKTGVSYKIDHTADICTVHPIGKDTWLSQTDNGGIRLNTPQEMFFLDDTFIYVGEKFHRGIECSVFSSLKGNIPGYSDMEMNVEIYFMKDGIQDSTDMTSTSRPVMIRIYNTTLDQETLVDIFEFNDEATSIIDKFDISHCFANNQKRNLTITFPADPNTHLSDKAVLTATITDKIAKTVSLNPIRVQETDVWWDSHTMYFTATLLDKPTASARFHRGTELIPKYIGDLTLPGVNSLEICADTCDDQSHATCNSFDVCAESCALYLTYNSTDRLQSPGKLCRRYSRVLSGPVDHELPLSDAYKGIEQMVRNGSFNISIPANGKAGGTTNLNFVATFITDRRKQTTATDRKKYLNPMAVLNRFDLTRNVQLMENQFPVVAVNVSGISLEDCAYTCMSELVFTCLAFVYWHKTTICSLHSLYPDQNPDLLAPCDGCDLYTRNWLQQYAQTPESIVPQGATTLRKIHSVNYCAMACVRLYECNTFHYSASQLICILFQLPTPLHSNADTTVSGWKYYTRIYLDDFVVTGFRYIEQEASKGFNSAMQDDCAKLCVNETSFRCQMFSWCEDFTMCSLYTLSLYDTDHVSTSPATKCWIYNREYNTDGSRFIPQFSHNASLSTPAVINTTPKTTSNTTLMQLKVAGGSDDSPNVPIDNATTLISPPATKSVANMKYSTPVIEQGNTNKVVTTTSEPKTTTTNRKATKLSKTTNSIDETTSIAYATLTPYTASTTDSERVSGSALNKTTVTHKRMWFGNYTASGKGINATVLTTKRSNTNTPTGFSFNTTLPTPNPTNRITPFPGHVNTTLPTPNPTNRITSFPGHVNTTLPTPNTTNGITAYPKHINTTLPTPNTTNGITAYPKHINTTLPTNTSTNSSKRTTPTMKTKITLKHRTSTTNQATPCSHVIQAPCVCPSQTTPTKTFGGREPECHPLSTAARSSYPTGTMAGLAVGMLLLGVIIGVAAIFLKNRFSTGSSNFSGKTFKNASFSP